MIGSVLWTLLFTLFTVTTPEITHCGNRRIVEDTAAVIEMIHSATLRYAKNQEWGVLGLGKLPVFAAKRLCKAKVSSDNEAEGALIAYRFFKNNSYSSIVRSIGTTEDIAYLKSVFEDFFSSNYQNGATLALILHRHMMHALGWNSMSMAVFRKKVMKSKLRGQAFNIYMRCVARGFYAMYWFNTQIK